MITLSKVVATFFGIGYIKKGAGTIAAAAYCTIWFFLPDFSVEMQLLSLLLVFIAGVWSAAAVEKIWEKDSARIVIDEVAGMLIALLFIPVKVKYLIAAFVLFRFFDILKPLGIKKMENLPSGWGVMADDVLSGIYSLAILQLAITLNIF